MRRRETCGSQTLRGPLRCQGHTPKITPPHLPIYQAKIEISVEEAAGVVCLAARTQKRESPRARGECLVGRQRHSDVARSHRRAVAPPPNRPLVSHDTPLTEGPPCNSAPFELAQMGMFQLRLLGERPTQCFARTIQLSVGQPDLGRRERGTYPVGSHRRAALGAWTTKLV